MYTLIIIIRSITKETFIYCIIASIEKYPKSSLYKSWETFFSLFIGRYIKEQYINNDCIKITRFTLRKIESINACRLKNKHECCVDIGR